MFIFLPCVVASRLKKENATYYDRIGVYGVILDKLTDELRKTHTKEEVLEIGWGWQKRTNR